MMAIWSKSGKKSATTSHLRVTSSNGGCWLWRIEQRRGTMVQHLSFLLRLQKHHFMTHFWVRVFVNLFRVCNLPYRFKVIPIAKFVAGASCYIATIIRVPLFVPKARVELRPAIGACARTRQPSVQHPPIAPLWFGWRVRVFGVRGCGKIACLHPNPNPPHTVKISSFAHLVHRFTLATAQLDGRQPRVACVRCEGGAWWRTKRSRARAVESNVETISASSCVELVGCERIRSLVGRSIFMCVWTRCRANGFGGAIQGAV